MLEVGKIWMVRTHSKEVLGPFSTRELLKHIELQQVLPGDEAAQSGETWIFVQNIPLESEAYYFNDPEQTPAASISGYYIRQSSTSGVTKTPLPTELEGGTRTVALSGEPTFMAGKPEVPMKFSGQNIATLLGAIAVGFLLWAGGTSSSLRSLSSLNGPSLLSGVNKLKRPEPTKLWMQEVEHHIELGEFAQALRKIEKFAKLNPNSKKLWIPHAALLIKNGRNLSGAEELLQKALSQNPRTNSHANFWLAHLALGEKNWKKAHQSFLEVLLADPKNLAALIHISKLELELNRDAEALKWLEKATLINPNFFLSQLIKGQALAKLNRLDEAKQAYELAIKLGPERWSSFAQYIQFLLNQGQRNAARENFARMLRTDPNYETSSPLSMNFNENLLPAPHYLELYNSVVEGKNNEETSVARSYLNYLEDSSTSGELSLDAANGNLFSRVLNLKVALDRGDNVQEVQRALSYLPENLDSFGYYAYLLTADAQARLGRVSEAKENIQRALELKPSSASARLAFASLLKRESQEVASLLELKRLLDLHPHYIPALKLGKFVETP